MREWMSECLIWYDLTDLNSPCSYLSIARYKCIFSYIFSHMSILYLCSSVLVEIKTYIYIYIYISLVQVLACCVIGDMPSTETILAYREYDHNDHTIWIDWHMIFGLEQEGVSLIAPMALVHPLHPIGNRSRNRRRNLWVGWCVSSWWPLFPSRSSVLIYIYAFLYEFCYRT